MSAPRVYDNENRASASDRTRNAVLAAYLDLLVESGGADVEVAAIATSAEVSQRTVFRFFKDKSALQSAAGHAIGSYLQRAEENSRSKPLSEFVREVFRSFDEASKLTTAYVLSSFGQRARTLMRAKLNQILIRRLRASYEFKLTRETRAKVNLIVSTISARVWYELRTDFGYTGDESSELIVWMIEALMRDLKAKAKRPGRSR
jgi:AcrR family transcriptional regulator